MAFFYNETREQAAKNKAAGRTKHIPIESMQKLGCRACPLDKADLRNPKIEPEGPSNPLIYVLGLAPGEDEDKTGYPIAGKSGSLIRSQFTDSQLKKDVRFNNTIKCFTGGENPGLAETECCRMHTVRDIEDSKPLVVIGMGNEVLSWATGMSGGATTWRGRLIATKIGKHACWFLPVLSPSYVLRKQGKYGKSEHEKVFENDIWELLNHLPEEPPKVYEAPFDRGITLIDGSQGATDIARLEIALGKMLHEPYVGLDYETSGLRPYAADAKLHMAAVGTFDNIVAFPLDHPKAWSNTFKKQAFGLFGEFLLQSGRKICHHLGFEMEWTAMNYGNQILRLTEWEDTLAQGHTLYETPGTHSLDDLVREHFGFNLKAQSPINLKTHKITDYPIEVALKYNALDVKWTYKLFEKLKPLIQANPKYVVEYERKVRLAPTLVLTQVKGVPVDFAYVAEMQKKLDGEISSIEGRLARCPEVVTYAKKFGKFEPTAPEQVLKLLKDICHRDEVKKAGGGETTDEEALSKIPADEVPSAPLILEHRAAAKLRSTYIEPLTSRKLTDPNGVLHTSYSSMRAVTGRLASSDPNLQNFPKRKRREIRGVIAAPAGQWMVAADYGQIEARVFGMASEDKNLVQYLWDGYDIHGNWADRFMQAHGRVKDRIIKDYGIDGDDSKKIRKTFRDEIKNGWVFPQFFGASSYSCAASLGVPEDTAAELEKEFWDEFKGVKKWQEKLLKFYDKHLYVETLPGRRRRGAMSKNEILNHPIQGTAADIVLEAMDAVSERSMIEEDPELTPNLNIHDDLSFFMWDESMEVLIPIVATEMCKHRFDFINVPLIVEVQVGPRWDQLEEIAVYRSNELFNLQAP